jgi:hypothetical protein
MTTQKFKLPFSNFLAHIVRDREILDKTVK